MNCKRYASNGLLYLKIIYPPNLYKSKLCFKFAESLFFGMHIQYLNTVKCVLKQRSRKCKQYLNIYKVFKQLLTL